MPLRLAAILLVLLLAAVAWSARGTPSRADNVAPEFRLELGYPGCGGGTVADSKANCGADVYGYPFTVRVLLDKAAGLATGQYYELGFTLEYSGAVFPEWNSWVIDWPLCTNEQMTYGDDFVHAECLGMPSNFTGLIGRVNFEFVPGFAQVSLVHGPGDTYVIDGAGGSNSEAGPDVMNIDPLDLHVTTTPTPTRTPRPTATPTPIAVGGEVALTGAATQQQRTNHRQPVVLTIAIAAAGTLLAGAGWYSQSARSRRW